MIKVGDYVKIINTEDFWNGLSGRVIDISDEEIITKSGKDFTDIMVKVDFPTENDTQEIIQIFPAYKLEKIEMTENLNEELDYNFEQLDENDDFIKDYVYLVDIDENEIPYWFFASQIATSESVTEEMVIQKAKELKYKVYRIEAPEYCKIVIAAPKCDKECIYTDYADFLQGKASIIEI